MQKKQIRPTQARKAESPQSTIQRPAATVFPFSAIVGQNEVKLGLILNVIDSSLGGVLIMGHRGTGKSTAVRALANLLTAIRVVQDCCFNCDPRNVGGLCLECEEELRTAGRLRTTLSAVPVVDLPLGAMEDRVCGSIDIQRALTEGVKAFEPGLLARANRGFLYIDEVNLLEDHLVDLLLDVAVTGRNKVERESISIEHPAQFVLIGSGNPEEGELRPQLLDRFALFIEVKTETEIEERVEIVERREAFERNREAFAASFADQQNQLRRRIERARRTFANVSVPRPLLRKIATICAELNVQGHRGELTIMRAARALAAFEGRKATTEADVRRVALMSLRHRIHHDGLSERGGSARIEQAMDKVFSEQGSGAGAESRGKHGKEEGKATGQSFKSNGRNGADAEAETRSNSTLQARLPALSSGSPSRLSRIHNSTSRSKAGDRSYDWRSGRYIQATARKHPQARVALDATLRALLVAGVGGDKHRGYFSADALRFKHFARKRGTLFIFAIDTSGSMAQARISKARGAVLNLLKKAYIDRDSVAIVGFRGTSAEVLLPPSRSILRARRVLESLGTGGGTPLSAALACSLEVAANATIQHEGRMMLLLFTDGGANVPLQMEGPGDRSARQKMIAAEIHLLGLKLRAARVQTFVVATQNHFVSQNQTQTIAELLRASHVRLAAEEQLNTDTP